MPPVIQSLATDYKEYGLTRSQADAIINNRFAERRDLGAGVQGRPRCIVLHIQEGTTAGSLSWWVQHDASSTVMIQRDGSILRVVDEKHGPWTNGDVNRPTPVGTRIASWPGNPNIWTLSIEAEGFANRPVGREQLDAIEWQVRTWQQAYDIPDGLVVRHADLNSVTRGFCPGAYYDEIIRRISTSSTPAPSTEYATPAVPAWMTEANLAEGIDRRIGSGVAKACRLRYTVTTRTPRLKYAYADAPRIGPDLTPGETFIGEFVVEGKDGAYVLTRWGSRIRSADLMPKVTIA